MEKANLHYVNQLANGDKEIKKMLIYVIKTEYPEEKRDYFESLQQNDFRKIEENVHKIKHKISILGLIKSYQLANEFEHNLREKSLEKRADFEQILKTIDLFLKTL